MDHANEQILLPGIGEELNVTLPAMVADHGKACCAVDLPVVVQNICEAPVHLVGLAGICGIATTSVALRRNLLPLGWQEMLVGGNVVFDDGQSTLKAGLQQAIQDH